MTATCIHCGGFGYEIIPSPESVAKENFVEIRKMTCIHCGGKELDIEQLLNELK